MRLGLFILPLFISVSVLAQNTTDSTRVKNSKSIDDLKKRIEAIEGKNTLAAIDNSELQKIIKKQQDSIVVLNQLLHQLSENQLTSKYNSNKRVDTKELNKDLNHSSLAKKELGDCKCVRIFYNPYQTAVNFEEFNELDSLVTVFLSHPDAKIRIVGHADKSGYDPNNIYLSQKRAMLLKAYLMKTKKISDKQITTEWHGSSQPSIDTQDPEKQFLNRRTEIFVE